MTRNASDGSLAQCNLIVGVTGSIAAYKAAALVRLLTKAGANVQILMTHDAARFVTPLTLGTLSGRKPLTDLFSGDGDWTKHVSLGLWADLIIIAPATAQTIAKLAHGFCDSMLTATVLAARCEVLVCPAMDLDMSLHAAVEGNLRRIRSYGYHVLPSRWGELASGLVGRGRLQEPEDILERIHSLLRPRTLMGKHALVTAGPTREPIDPVRVVTNHSTGTMGFALAESLRDRGAHVTLVSGPTLLETPGGIERIDVTTADDMYEACLAYSEADCVFMAAAVADYAPASPADSKLKKTGEELTITFRRTPDTLAELGRQKRPGQLLVGFAMETHDCLDSARGKLRAKNLDWIVLNNVLEDGAGFGIGTNRVTVLGRDGSVTALGPMPKRKVADAILDRLYTPGKPPSPRR